MKKKIVPIIFSALFLLALLVPLFTTSLKQGDLSESENRTLAKFPQFVDPNGKISRKAVFAFEGWFNDHIGLRSVSSRMTAAVKLGVFHSSPAPSVFVGREGWYYFTYDNNLRIPFGDFPLSEETLQNIADSQESIRSELEQMGIQYILVITPSKASIYPENISSQHLAVRETPIDTLTAYLQTHTNVTVVNTKPALLEVKANGEQVYFKTDTHWNTIGSSTGFQSIASSIEQVCGKDMLKIELSFSLQPRKGDLRALMNAVSFTEPEQAMKCAITNPGAKKEDDSALAKELDRIQNQPGNGWQGPSEVWYNESAQGTVLMFGDSFFGPDFKMSEYFAECYHETVLVRCVTAYRETVELVSPDLVIMEITERNIPVLASRALK
jgi:hypothetical protein